MQEIHKISPVTGEKIGEFEAESSADVPAAVEKARAAFRVWREVPLRERLRILGGLRGVVHDYAEEYAWRISEDTGKPLVDSLTTELMSIPLFLDYYVKEAEKILGRKQVRSPLVFAGRRSYVEYFPMGVIAVIAPWNFPFQLSVVPMISALIGGNAVVLKPSGTTPITGEVIRDMFSLIDLPEGLVTVLQGDGATGAALTRADVDKVFFTGSVATGRKVMAAAAGKPIPVELELGGKDAMIVLADANLKRAARAAAWGGLLNCGQMCTSVERILVVEAVHDRFVEMLLKEVERVKVGGPDEDADMGPMIFAPQLETVDRHVREAVQAGARVLSGGARLARQGSFYAPTLIAGVTPEMSIYREETFGPVLPVVKVKDAEEAVRLANQHQYGLTGSVWTRDIAEGQRLASRLECGQVVINDVALSVGNPALPFGGVKSSGFGRYHGPEGLLAFVHSRAVMVDRGWLDSEPIWFPYAGKYPALLKALRSLSRGKLLGALGSLVKLMRSGRHSRNSTSQ